MTIHKRTNPNQLSQYKIDKLDKSLSIIINIYMTYLIIFHLFDIFDHIHDIINHNNTNACINNNKNDNSNIKQI